MAITNGVHYPEKSDTYNLALDFWRHAISDAQQALDATNAALIGANAYTDGEIAKATLGEGILDATDPTVAALVGTSGTASRTQVDARADSRINSLAVTKAGHDSEIAGLSDDDNSLFRAALTRSSARPVGRGEQTVHVADYGALGEGLNDYWPIQAAINASGGKDILLDSGVTYTIGGTLTVPPGRDSISIRSTGVRPAVLKLGADGQSYPAIKFDAGDAVATTQLTASVGINTRGWPVASTAGITVGMLCEVVSSASWYHDPRPERTDSRKSELHRVSDVRDGSVYFDDVAFDGYDLTDETVELRFYRPIKVRLENITVRGVLPAVAEESKATEGIVIRGADAPELINVSAENCARTGVAIYRSYRPTLSGGYSRRSNNYYNGYGAVINGCTHALVQDRHTYESRKGVDVTGFTVVSRVTVIDRCRTIGGGVNSRGENYGWNPDGTFGAHQAGFGSHGGAEDVWYTNNYVSDVQAPFTIRGRSSWIDSNFIKGRTTGGVVQAANGIHLYVTNNNIVAGYWSLKVNDSFSPTPLNNMRADTIVTISENWQSNPPSGTQRGQLVVAGNVADLRRAIVRMHMLHRGELFIGNNRALFVDDPIHDFYVLDNHSGEAPGPLVASAWHLGPNVARVPSGVTGAAVLMSTRSITGVNILEYVTAP